jgi:hypothetical protein
MKITSAQKLYQSISMGFGCVITGSTQIQLHHVMGRTAKVNKVWVGQWFAIPLHFSLHDVGSNEELNVSHHRHKFTAEYGTQADLWLARHEEIIRHYSKAPTVPQSVIDSIRASRY